MGGTGHFRWLDVVRVCPDSTCATGIQNAVVTINGTALTLGSTPGEYDGNVSILPSTTITLRVVINNSTYEGSATQFAQNQVPTFTNQTEIGPLFADGLNTLRWNSAHRPGAVYFEAFATHLAMLCIHA